MVYTAPKKLDHSFTQRISFYIAQDEVLFYNKIGSIIPTVV